MTTEAITEAREELEKVQEKTQFIGLSLSLPGLDDDCRLRIAGVCMEAQVSCQRAIAQLRAAEAEAGWRPIAEMPDYVPGGVRLGYQRSDLWVMTCWIAVRPSESLGIYTHYFVISVPPPPAREGQ